MGSKLWFVTDGANLIGAFANRSGAEREIQRYQNDPDYDYYDYYGIDVDELEDHMDEYDFTQENGIID